MTLWHFYLTVNLKLLYKSNRETLPATHILSISGLASQLIYKIPSRAGGKQKFSDSSIGNKYQQL